MKKLLLGILASMALVSGGVLAAWPERPIKIVVPYPPGGPTDFLARLAADGMQSEIGQSFVVENRPGASAIIGTSAVARAPADGYTLLLTPAALSINAAMRNDLPFNFPHDFDPVIQLGRGEGIVAVNSAVDIHNLKELVSATRSDPEKYMVATAGRGTNTHMALVQFKNMSGASLQHVPYKGAGQAVIDVVSGNVPIMFGGITELKPHIQSGKLRAIAILENSRSPSFPSVPTADEQGFTGLRIFGYFGLMVKQGTAPEIIEKLNRAANTALSRPSAQESAQEIGVKLVGGSAETFGKVIADTNRIYTEIVSAAGADLD
ncbi:Bug family tripartite tricarboxylate transporter substrate binding protein [Allopusillimonas ginsengisoli]|uniref:Bug family tripartite tricarboxylate transporter substrate binding protein n=1 Tax=Allopusillimonas ginsengisoli TaxID=453575 RepID=UPI0014318516|nr:tripartite tricarboxylate transporter substrate-binding protein [Allopusillimonas ginsengisoli]